jgi:hypothetical protein
MIYKHKTGMHKIQPDGACYNRYSRHTLTIRSIRPSFLVSTNHFFTALSLTVSFMRTPKLECPTKPKPSCVSCSWTTKAGTKLPSQTFDALRVSDARGRMIRERFCLRRLISPCLLFLHSAQTYSMRGASPRTPTPRHVVRHFSKKCTSSATRATCQTASQIHLLLR